MNARSRIARWHRPSDTFAQYIAEARQTKRWSQDDLSEAMKKLGMPMDRTVIAKIEGGYRKDIGLNEVVTLCAALGVAPLHMIVPWDDDWMVALGARGLERKDAAPKAMEPAHVVRDWFVGKRALRVTDDTRLYHYMQKPPQAVVDNAKARKKERKS